MGLLGFGHGGRKRYGDETTIPPWWTGNVELPWSSFEGPSNALFEICTQIIENILIYYNYDPKTYINTLECLNNESVENFHEKNRVNSEKRKEGNRGEGKNDRNKKTPKPIKEAQTVPAPATQLH